MNNYISLTLNKMIAMKHVFIFSCSIILIALFPINQAFSQENAIDSSPKSHFFVDGGVGLTVLQEKNSPTFYGNIGVGDEDYRLSLTGAAHYFFSTTDNSSRERSVDGYLGLEFLWPYTPNEKNKNWGGVGVAYCLKNESELHKKNPIKAYYIHYLGIIGVSAEYVWGDFFYPAIGIRIGSGS
tara:strand:- start:524 stop:1072 length:549 start_codon:yes stop_codon:yes gene_type:complete